MKGRSNENGTFATSRARNRRRAARGGRGARATEVLLRWIEPCGRADVDREAEVSRAVYGRAEGGWGAVRPGVGRGPLSGCGLGRWAARRKIFQTAVAVYSV